MLHALRSSIFRPLVSPTTKSASHILSRPIDTLLTRMTSHYSLPQINQWPQSATMEWTYWKQHDIREKLLALKARGKGPLAKEKAQRKRKSK